VRAAGPGHLASSTHPAGRSRKSRLSCLFCRRPTGVHRFQFCLFGEPWRMWANTSFADLACVLERPAGPVTTPVPTHQKGSTGLWCPTPDVDPNWPRDLDLYGLSGPVPVRKQCSHRRGHWFDRSMAHAVRRPKQAGRALVARPGTGKLVRRCAAPYLVAEQQICLRGKRPAFALTPSTWTAVGCG